MALKKLVDLVNSTFTKFRLAPIMRVKSVDKLIKGEKDSIETLPFAEGVNIEKKSKNFDSYFVIGTVKIGKEGFDYEDCGFRTIDEIRADEFIEFKNIIEYAKILLEFSKKDTEDDY